MKIFGPKPLAPACVPDRPGIATPTESNRHRVNRVVIETRKGRSAAALLLTPDALYVVFLNQGEGRFCCRCACERGERLTYQRGKLTSGAARFAISRLIANLNPDDEFPLWESHAPRTAIV